MPARRPDHRHHGIAVVPAAMFLLIASAPWGGAAAPTTEPRSDSTALPEPTVPTDAIEAPAGLTNRGVVARGARKRFDDAVASASTSGIPSAALSAYQRAETVINAADKSCNLPWQLIAAVGRVESDHGRYGGNRLDDQGRATPGIFGIALDGSNNTAVIRDTDAGQYDSDAKWDRAVGPMQFIPSTWSVVGVDGDNDGKRNPQDIDDAALATAVYLCSGNDDLSTETGLRPAVFRYNHSHRYVDLVLSYMDAYMEGDFTSVPNVATSYSGTLAPTPGGPADETIPYGRNGGRSQRGLESGLVGRDGSRDASISGGDALDSDITPGSQGPDLDGEIGGGTDDGETGGNTGEEPGGETKPPVEEETPPAEDETPPADDETPPADDETPPAEDETPPAEEPATEAPATEDEAIVVALEKVGVAPDTAPTPEALGALYDDFAAYMEELGFPQE